MVIKFLYGVIIYGRNFRGEHWEEKLVQANGQSCATQS